MKLKQNKIYLALALLIMVSLACSLTGEPEVKPEVPPDRSAEDSIATSVAETLAAAESESPAESSPPALEPTEEEVKPPLPEPNFNYAGVSFYFSELLAENLTAGVTPGTYDENSPWWSKPEHREYHFNKWVLSDGFHVPAIRVYPVIEFRAINENVSGGLDQLGTALEDQPLDGEGLLVSDMFNAGQLFQAQIKYLDFQNGSGARWLSQYGQAYYGIGWPYLFYTFQGLTEDEMYYVSIILPVTHPSLPDPDDITMDQAFYDNYEVYAEQIKNDLNNAADPSFMPSLVLLDQIVETLSVGSQ
jgi:hypothetical protein